MSTIWQWTTSAAPSIILSGNNIGEFSVKRIGSTYCMSYFDVDDYSISTRTAPRPDAVAGPRPPPADRGQQHGDRRAHWGKPQNPVSLRRLHPPSSASATSLTLIVSQWNGQQNQPPYWSSETTASTL